MNPEEETWKALQIIGKITPSRELEPVEDTETIGRTLQRAYSKDESLEEIHFLEPAEN